MTPEQLKAIEKRATTEDIPALIAEVKRLREALEKISELEKPGCYDNDPLGMGIVSNSYQIARKALEGK